MRLKKGFGLVRQYLSHLLSYELNLPLEKPTEINFQITNRCPLNCKMCNIVVDSEKEEDLLSATEIKQLLTEIKNWADNDRYVSFVGGEALVRKETTLEAIRHAHELGFHTSIVTNGYFLGKKESKELLDSGVDRVSVSLDGPDRETHDEIRGKGSFKRALGAVKNLEVLRRKNYRSQQLKLDINTVIMADNFQKLPEIHQLALREGADELFLQSAVPDNRYQETDYNKDYWIDGKDINQLKQIIKKLIDLKLSYGIINNSIKYLKEVPHYFAQKDRYQGGKCLAGYMNLNITPDGRISTCSFGPNLNVRSDHIKNLWKSEEYKETRKRIKNCDKPCMMLCYRKLSLKELISKLRRELYA